MTVTDTNGYDANSTAQLQIGWGAWGGADGCYLIYSIQANALYLIDDTGATLLGPAAPGSTPSSPLKNSQCAINVPQTAATLASSVLTLNASITFDPSFVGTLPIRPLVNDTSGLAVRQPASYVAFAANASPPTIVSFPIPPPGYGSTISSLVLQVSDPNEAKYVRWAGISYCCDSTQQTYILAFYDADTGIVASYDSDQQLMTGGPQTFGVSRLGNTLTVSAVNIDFAGFVDSNQQPVEGGPWPMQGFAGDASNNSVAGGGGTWWAGNVEVTSPTGSWQYAMMPSGSGSIAVTAASSTQWTASARRSQAMASNRQHLLGCNFHSANA